MTVEVHYGKLTRDRWVIYLKDGRTTVDLGWEGSEVKTEVRAQALAVMIAALRDNYDNIDPIRDEVVPPRSIIGRERLLTELVAKVVRDATWREFETTDLRDLPRGFYFEAKITTKKGEATGRVARITIELDRVEEEGD